MTRYAIYSIYNLLIYIIGIILMNFFYSPFNFFVIILTYGLIIASFVLGMISIIRLLKQEIKAIIFLIIALIPIFDFLTDYHDKVFDFFKPEKELVAIRNLGTSSDELTLLIDSKFDYREQSCFGARIYKGTYIKKSDSLTLTFSNKLPNGINDTKLIGCIKVRKLDFKLTNDHMINFTIKYIYE